MGLFTLIIMIVGWVQIGICTFGRADGLGIHVGNLTGVPLGLVLVVLALCVGVGAPLVQPYIRRA